MKINVLETKIIPSHLRSAYLDSLSEAQEFHFENLVRNGTYLLIRQGDEAVGYGVISDRSVVEFYMLPQASRWMAEAFQAVLENSKATCARCKSFDSFMVAAATTMPAQVRTGGILFRNIIDPSFRADPLITATLGKQEDTETILEIHDGFFDNREEVLSYINENGLFLFRSDGNAVGCGILKRIIPDRNDFDVGMVVAPAHRRKGLGSYIVAYVKSHCLQQGYNPVCGCNAGNLASRRSLEKAGFTSLHSIIEITY